VVFAHRKAAINISLAVVTSAKQKQQQQNVSSSCR